MPTLSRLLADLAKKHSTSKRPLRYFDVPKRGQLTPKEVAYVKRRFKDLLKRERCVRRDPNDPRCYDKTPSDISPRMAKRTSSFLRDYEAVYRPSKMTIEEFYAAHKGQIPRGKAPKGLKRIAVETGLPLKYLKNVYDIGVGAYATSGSRTGMSAEQWGYGRVYAFIMSYFHNTDGRYDNQRFLKNRTDFHIFEDILEDAL